MNLFRQLLLISLSSWLLFCWTGRSNVFVLTQNEVPVDIIVEPDSTTNQYGINIGFRLSF
ncbi:MAG TPA: hypothetical protein DDW65_05935 [Firmicutes bacterium]|nr:hypothetical protein [Bacillota bacterium]